MKIIPAIDLINGKCVRLKQGDYSEQKIYSNDAVEVAKTFEKDGADMIHIVDLDGAKSGSQKNFETIRNIVKNIKIPVEVGGGVRSEETILKLLNIGVYRIILGTKALENLEFVKEMIEKFGAEKIVVGVDAKNGLVAVKGWQEISKIKAIDFIKNLEKAGVRTIIYTDIATDGMMKGPNFEEILKVREVFKGELVASGGVSCKEDIFKLKKIGCEGVIVGKAVYEGKIKLKELRIKS
jgi:phosphoribosylformimino-5-aminoimidazole carboxamide ribotide isomerase